MTGEDPRVEDQIEQWRSYLVHRDAIASADVDELEGHLRDQIDGLEASGLSPDEAFLVAVSRTLQQVWNERGGTNSALALGGA